MATTPVGMALLGPSFSSQLSPKLVQGERIMFLYGEFDLEDGSVSRKWRMSNPLTGGLLNRRSFVTGLSSVCSLVLLRGGLASSEHKSALEQRIRSQMDLGVSNELTVGAVMMVVQRDKVLALEAAGYSDLDTKRRMRTDAIFDIRSISKPITVFGALLLVTN
jgi:beta-lactamase family protein